MNGEPRSAEIALLALLICIIQISASTYLRVALYADLTLVFVLYLGWRCSPMKAIGAGCLLGLLQDISLLLPYWGMNGLSKTVSAFVAVSLSRWIWLENSASRFLAIALFSAAEALLSAAVLTLLGRHWPLSDWTALSLRALVTGVAGVFFFHFYDRFKVPAKSFRQQP